MIDFVVPGGLESRARVLGRTPNHSFAVEYFGWTCRFDLHSDATGGTDLTLQCTAVPEDHRMEVAAGWVSVLMAMKAWVDHGVDLRNHDPHRTWWQGFVDN